MNSKAVNSEGNTPRSYSSIVRGYTNTELHTAVRENDERKVLELLQKGADPNRKNDSNDTPVHEAVLQGSYKILKLLVENGGDINMTGSNGRLPLQMVTSSKNQDFMDAVLACDPDVNKKDGSGTPVLIYFVHEHYDRVRDILRLLECGSNPNIKNINGWNCLHFVASEWDTSKATLTRLLLQYRIDINAETLKGLTALQLAYGEPDTDFLIHILLQNNAEFPSKFKKYKPIISIGYKNLLSLCAHACLRNVNYLDFRQGLNITRDVAISNFAHAYSKCQEELAELKNTSLKKYKFDLYDFLKYTPEQICKLNKDEDFKTEIGKYILSFSIYSNFLMDQVLVGVHSTKAKKAVSFYLSETLNLPILACDKIVSNYNTKELMFLYRHIQIL